MTVDRRDGERRRPRLDKRLGQHHLASPALCRPVLDELERAGGEVARVVEIGAGGGVLTGELLDMGLPVTALELDREWAYELHRRLPHPALGIALVDALEIEWSRLRAGTAVVGNLPYQISTVLISRLLASLRHDTRCVFLVQREVASRLLATPGDSDYGAMSVLAAARARVRSLGRVRPGSFVPPPKVESAYVGLWIEPSRIENAVWPSLVSTVHAAFSKRRKTLRNSLASIWGKETASAVLARVALPQRVRAEQLGVDELRELRDVAERLGVFSIR